MPFKKVYTPYSAVGEWAARSGQARQAVRDQQIAEQVAAQERSIEAGREQWQTQLGVQQQQFTAGQQLSREQTLAQQQASELSTLVQGRAERQRLAQQQQQFQERLSMEQEKLQANIRAQQNSFQLQQAQEARMFQTTQQVQQHQQQTQMLQQEKWDFSKQQTENNLQLQQQWVDNINASNMSPHQKTQALANLTLGRGVIPSEVRPPRPQDVKPWGRLDTAAWGETMKNILPQTEYFGGLDRIANPEEIKQAVAAIKLQRDASAYDIQESVIQGQMNAITLAQLETSGYKNTTVASQLGISPESIKAKMMDSGKAGVFSKDDLTAALQQFSTNLQQAPKQ